VEEHLRRVTGTKNPVVDIDAIRIEEIRGLREINFNHLWSDGGEELPRDPRVYIACDYPG